MPRVTLDPAFHKKKAQDLIRNRIRGSDYNQTQIARAMNLSQGTFSKKLSDMSFTWLQLVTICDMLELTDKERLRLVKK